MKKYKILFFNNRFGVSDGTAKALTGLVNKLDPDKYDITIRPIYNYDQEAVDRLNKNIKFKPVFGFDFKGFRRIVRRLPMKWLYRRIVKEDYDIEIGFQCEVPTMLVANSTSSAAVHVAWMHCYEVYEEEYKKLDKVVCVSKYCADKTREAMGSNTDVTYCNNLVDDFAIRRLAEEQVNLKFDKFTFVTVGRLSPEKGYERLIKICKNLASKGYNFRLIIIGDGPERKKLQSEITEYGLEKTVIMTGAQSNPHKYTSKADVFVCSSFDEGYSTACTEAAILGVPIITTCVPGGEEIIESCGCGKLTSLDDSSLQEAMELCLKDSAIVDEWKERMHINKEKFYLSQRLSDANRLFDEFCEISNRKRRLV